MIKQAKIILRKKIREKLRMVSKESISTESIKLTSILVGLEEYKQAKNISVYLSMDGEIDTSYLVKSIFNDKKSCFVPVIDSKRGEMEMVKLNDMDDYLNLPQNSWGIKEPKLDESRELIMSQGTFVDLIIAPGLCFDREGWRLGHGKGYYDKYLSRCFKYASSNNLRKPPVICVALNAQMVDELVPRDLFDVKPDMVLSSDLYN